MNLRDELLKKAEEMAAEKLGMDPKQVQEQIDSLMGKSRDSGDTGAEAEAGSEDEDEKPARRRADTGEDEDDRPARKNEPASDDSEDSQAVSDEANSAPERDTSEADSEDEDEQK